MKSLHTIVLLAAALALGGMPAHAQTQASEPFHFVTFELGEVVAKSAIQGVYVATYRETTTEVALSARAGETLQGSLSIPANDSAGDWSIVLRTLDGATLLRAAGTLTSEGIQILGSSVDSSRLDLPRETTSLRIVKGYVSATVTLVALLKDPSCCTATLGIDADADGVVAPSETQSVTASTPEVRVAVVLPRAAPSVPYLFTIDAGGRTVARASGTYSFTNLNGVSATGEFDPAFVEYVTGSVERQPHLVQHDIGSGILLQSVAGAERQEEGPRVFFTMGTPRVEAAPTATDDDASAPAAPAAAADTESATLGTSLLRRVLALFTGPVFLAILLGSVLAAVLAFMARRMIERAR